jgi:exodeoxyribonuclease V alpha subunit
MPELINPWWALASDEILWEGFPEDQEFRRLILDKIVTGEIAISCAEITLTDTQIASIAQISKVFRTVKFAGASYLVPQRFARLVDFFPEISSPAESLADAHEAAQAVLLSGKNLLLTGGPGTGKSHAIGKYVTARSAAIADRPIRVTIVAPTGKAAARFQALPRGENILLECATIHRILGFDRNGNPRLGPHNPLGSDIVVIDEISMVDLGLLTMLVNALPPQIQLVIAGDLDQLPAVDGIPVDNFISLLIKLNLIAHVHLTKTHRFSTAMAESFANIRTRGLAGISEKSEGLHREGVIDRNKLAVIIEAYARDHYCNSQAGELRALCNAIAQENKISPEQASALFAFHSRKIILTERRETTLGSLEINKKIEKHIAQIVGSNARLLTPVIVTRNLYSLGLFNGDVGIIISSAPNEQVIFQSSTGEFRRFALNEVSDTETAYALTIHKSQGSEFDDVVIVCDAKVKDRDNRLIYTAVTRARRHATVLECN